MRQVSTDIGDAIAEALEAVGRFLEHGSGAIEGDDPAVGQPLQQSFRQAARPAACVEDAFISSQHQAVQCRCSHGRVRGGDAVIGVAAPLAHVTAARVDRQPVASTVNLPIRQA